MALLALRAALLVLAAQSAHGSACTVARGARGVENFDPRRYAGVWFQQAAWGTGARAMSWCAASLRGKRASHLTAQLFVCLKRESPQPSLKTTYTSR